MSTKPAAPPVKGAGKRATLQKRQLYANALPVGISQQTRTWGAWLRSFISASPRVARGWYDPLTNSVWLRDEGDAAYLWTHGFFGKGNLSRSEPTFVARKQAEFTARSRGELTAEQMTQRRREERKLLKIERARAAVAAGIQLPDGVTALGGEMDSASLAGDKDAPVWRGDEAIPQIEAGVSRVKGLKYFNKPISEDSSAGTAEIPPSDDPGADAAQLYAGTEHFQLTMVEAFFLCAMLGCLDVCGSDDKPLDASQLYQLCLSSPGDGVLSHAVRRPDNPFLVSYVAYHYFRSQGWVVKSGTKFCVDYLLYKRGPVFGHAEFSVLVVPEYEDAGDAVSSPFQQHHNGGNKDWVWFSTMNRVNSQVQKTLILAHVLIPPMRDFPAKALESVSALVDSLRSRTSYRVAEVAIRRWVPARMKA